MNSSNRERSKAMLGSCTAPQPDIDSVESTACPLCGSDQATDSPYASPPFHVVRCSHCQLWYLNPRPAADTAMANYESDQYFSGAHAGYENYSSQEQSLRAGFRDILARLKRHGLTGGRLLEVGSGYGYFLVEARKYYDECVGVELSPLAADAARTLSGATILNSIEAIDPDEEFDLVFASHVIEHIYDPVPFTEKLVAHLRPGGTIVYSTPDMNSFWRKLMGRHWPSFKIPEHVAFFDSNTLARLFTTANAVSHRRIGILDRFPASEILAKLGLPAPRVSARINVPLPATSVCMLARAPARPAQ